MTPYEVIKTIFLVFIIIAIGSISSRYNKAIEAEGIAISEYLSTYQGLDIEPEKARFYKISVNMYDIQVSDVTVLY